MQLWRRWKYLHSKGGRKAHIKDELSGDDKDLPEQDLDMNGDAGAAVESPKVNDTITNTAAMMVDSRQQKRVAESAELLEYRTRMIKKNTGLLRNFAGREKERPQITEGKLVWVKNEYIRIQS